MKRSILLFALILGFIAYSSSQSKYGNVTNDELSMTTYEPDTTASAVVLLSKGDTRFIYDPESGFQIQTNIQVKMKILKPEGLDRCNVSISYYVLERTRAEKIMDLSGTTYNLEDGKIVKTKLSKEYITDEDADNKYRIKKFSMPGAKVGSVVEYKYSLISDFYYNIRDFYFQQSIPVIYASYTIKIPEYYNFNVNQQGYERLENKKEPVNETFQIRYYDTNNRLQTDMVSCLAQEYSFVGRNIPAMKKETHIWSLTNYISKVSFELQSSQLPHGTFRSYTTTWDQVDTNIFETSSITSNLKKEGLFKDDVEKKEPTLQYADEIQKMIKEKVKWNDKDVLLPKDLKDALKTGLGSSADMNYLLINALNAGGFDAYPVILSTRSNGLLPIIHPSLDGFNYVITGVKIGDKEYFTDASAKYGSWNVLPEECMVNQARKLIKGRCAWVDLSTLNRGQDVLIGQIYVDKSALCKKVTEVLRGNYSYDFRRQYYSFKDHNEYLEKRETATKEKLDTLLINGLDDTSKDIKVDYVAKMDGAVDDDLIYVSPMLEKHMEENPFTAENRTLPINFRYLTSYRQIVDINIPEGYVVEELPKSEKFVLGDNAISLNYAITQNEDVIKFQYNYSLGELLFLADEYPYLKEFFAKIVAKNSEMIVFKKGEAETVVAKAD